MAFEKVDNYVHAWKKNNLYDFLGLLHRDVVIKTWSNKQMSSRDAAEDWFKEWQINDNKVVRWEMKNYYFDSMKEKVIAEWVITFRYEDEEKSYSGASIFGFEVDKIVRIHEYIVNKHMVE